MSHSACVSCHQRKVRCDAHIGGFPCSNCKSSGKPNCQIHQKKRRAAIRSAYSPVPIYSRSSTVATSNAGTRPAQASPGTAVLQSSVELPPFWESEPEQADTRDDPQGSTEDDGDSQRPIHKGIRITYVGKDVSNTSFLVRQRLEGHNQTVYHFPSRQIARKYMRHESDHIPPDAFMLPDKALADELVNAYFMHVNPGCPILDEDIFMAQYGGENPANPPSLLILQAILLVGAHVSRPRPERDTLKAIFFRRAKLLFDSRVEWNRDFMVQAALLLTWYSDGAEDTCANAWYWVGAAARIATGLGMHRDTKSSNLSAIDKSRWHRTWWILFQYDVTVSLFYGRPQSIILDECDVPPLDANNFENCGARAEVEYVIKSTELCVLISRVLRKRFGLRSTPEQRKAALSDADEALANWCLMLPPALHLRSSDTNLWAGYLHLTYSNFLILLHRPNPRASQKFDDSGPNDADICIAAANAITTILEDLRKKDGIKYLWISGVNALFTAMIQVSVELRFSNPILAIHARRRFDSTLASLRELAEYWIIAESILHLFEETSRINSGTRDFGTSAAKIRSKRNTIHHRHHESPPTMNSSPSQTIVGHSGRRSVRSDLDVLASAANAAVARINSGLIEQEQEEVSDWRQLFPYTNSDQETLSMPEDMTSMETEWREIYWQELCIPESFADGFGNLW